jgi:broad specificity phosphatase PhoE
VAQLASAPGLGPGGRRFKSFHPDQIVMQWLSPGWRTFRARGRGHFFVVYAHVQSAALLSYYKPPPHAYNASMLKIYLVRHGQNKDNAEGILNGHRDEPLTNIGVAQAHEIATKVKDTGIIFDKVYASPLQRAYKTAEIITDAIHLEKPEIMLELIERDFGVMTGKLQSKIMELCSPDILQTDTITYFLKPDGAETFPQLLERANKLLANIRLKHENGNILLVTHGDFGKMIYAAYYGLDWLDVLKLFHFGNSDLLKLSPESHYSDTHVHKIEQYNL